MTSRSETGKLGEDIACDFLKNNGSTVLFRNVLNKFGEIDIVARDHGGTLVFVEVKTIRQSSWQAIRQCGNSKTFAEFMPEDQMGSSKMRKFKRIAGFFANEHQELFDEDASWRLDFVGVIFDDSGAHAVRHYKNI